MRTTASWVGKYSRSQGPRTCQWAQDYPAGSEECTSLPLLDQRQLLIRHWGGQRDRLGARRTGPIPRSAPGTWMPGLPAQRDDSQTHLSLSQKLHVPKEAFSKQHHRWREPSRTQELILHKPLTELRWYEQPLARDHTAPRLWPDSVSPGAQPSTPPQRFL